MNFKQKMIQMVTQIYSRILLSIICTLISVMQLQAQKVAIGTTSLDDGVIFQLEDTNKGLMIPNVALTDRLDVTTITPSEIEGLWVYNTSNSGSGNDRVSVGFYFWDSDEWIRMYSEGFTVQYEQTAGVRSPDNSTWLDLTGLNQSFIAPYTGIYEIVLSAYIASPGQANASYEAVVHGEAAIFIDGTKVASNMVTSSTKLVPGNYLALGQQVTVPWNVVLSAGTTYTIVGRVRQWQWENVSTTSLDSFVAGNYAIWGIPTSLYNGNDLGIDNAQDAYLTITLLRQY